MARFDWDACVGNQVSPRMARQECAERGITYRAYAEEWDGLFEECMGGPPPDDLVDGMVAEMERDEAWWAEQEDTVEVR